jgi:hypothetical protein
VGEGSAQQMVFKFARDARVPRGACFAEAEAQAQAGQWARRFNAELPGSRLCFVECFVSAAGAAWRCSRWRVRAR